MLRDNGQQKLRLSPYQGLYDIIVPKAHLLRKIKENIDFSFVTPMLRKQYCENFGRPAKEPEMMRETIRQATEKGVIKSTAIIVDSTHTTANARTKDSNTDSTQAE